MKKIALFFVIAMALSISAIAQDLIVFTNADEVKARVVSIYPDEIKYIPWDNLEGPTYTVLKRDVFFIKFANGKKEVFTTVDDAKGAGSTVSYEPRQPSEREDRAIRADEAARAAVASEDEDYYGRGSQSDDDEYSRSRNYEYDDGSSRKQRSDWHYDRPCFQVYFPVFGTVLGPQGGGPTTDVTFGVRLWDYVYLGAELGFQFPYGGWNYLDNFCLTVGNNVRVYIPTGTKCYPYFNFSLGAECLGPSAYTQVGFGFDAGRFSLNCGYSLSNIVERYRHNYDYRYYTEYYHAFYFKIGVRLGKNPTRH